MTIDIYLAQKISIYHMFGELDSNPQPHMSQSSGHLSFDLCTHLVIAGRVNVCLLFPKRFITSD